MIGVNKEMVKVWREERGSALLVVLVAVMVLGLMLGSVALVVRNTGEQATRHEQQVQAEFQAQRAMEIALYLFYEQPEQFQQTFRQESPACLSIPEDPQIQVCVESATDAEGQLMETLVARSSETQAFSTIRFALPTSH